MSSESRAMRNDLNDFLQREDDAYMNYEEMQIKARGMVQHDKEFNPYTINNFIEAINQADEMMLATFIGELLIHEPPSTGIKIAHEYWMRQAMAELEGERK